MENEKKSKVIKTLVGPVISLIDFYNKHKENLNDTYVKSLSGGDCIELSGKFLGKNMIWTVEAHEYTPRDEYGEAGYSYEDIRKRKVKRNDEWAYIEEKIIRYFMSSADQKFIYNSYVNCHLNQRQISDLSGIPQPNVYRYIKHYKLKPAKKKEKDHFLNASNIDFDKEFKIDPYPTRSEWKVRREDFGLKNGENWRNGEFDANPGKKIQGDGSTSQKRKKNKVIRRLERKESNTEKFNK